MMQVRKRMTQSQPWIWTELQSKWLLWRKIGCCLRVCPSSGVSCRLPQKRVLLLMITNEMSFVLVHSRWDHGPRKDRRPDTPIHTHTHPEARCQTCPCKLSQSDRYHIPSVTHTRSHTLILKAKSCIHVNPLCQSLMLELELFYNPAARWTWSSSCFTQQIHTSSSQPRGRNFWGCQAGLM